MAFAPNRRETKMLLRYDGHNRQPGVNTRDHAMKWRRIRRRFSRWMKEKVEHIEVEQDAG